MISEKEELRRRFWAYLAHRLALVQSWVLLQVSEEPVWVSRDGTTKKVSEMDNRHIRNVVRKLERDEDNGPVHEAVLAEARKRGIIRK